MSHEAFAYAKALKVKSSPQKLLLLLLAERINNETGKCFPGQTLLAEEATMSISQVKANLKAMEEKGYVVRSLIHNDRGHIVGTHYEIPGFLPWLKAGKNSAQTFWEEARPKQPKSGNPTEGGAEDPKSGKPTDPPSDFRKPKSGNPTPNHHKNRKGTPNTDSSLRSESGASAENRETVKEDLEEDRHPSQEDGAGPKFGFPDLNDVLAAYRARKANGAGQSAAGDNGAGPGSSSSAAQPSEAANAARNGSPSENSSRAGTQNTKQKVQEGSKSRAKSSKSGSERCESAAQGQEKGILDAEFEEVPGERSQNATDGSGEPVTLQAATPVAGREIAPVRASTPARAKPKPQKTALYEPSKAFWPVWHALEKAFKSVKGAELILVQGARKTGEAFDAVEGVESYVPMIFAAIPVWKAQVLQMITSGKGSPCTAATWLSEGRWESMQPADMEEEDEVPADYQAAWEAQKELFDVSSTHGKGLVVWNMMTQKERDLAKRALRFRRMELDNIVNSTGGKWTSSGPSDVDKAQRESRRKGVRFDQWLSEKGWREHQADLDLEVVGFTSPRPELIKEIAEYLFELDGLKNLASDDYRWKMLRNHHRSLHRQLGGLSVDLLEQKVPAEILAEAKAKCAALVEEDKQKKIARIREIARPNFSAAGTLGCFRDAVKAFSKGEKINRWNWDENLGPPLGEKGCLVPQDVIDHFLAEIDEEEARKAREHEAAMAEEAF